MSGLALTTVPWLSWKSLVLMRVGIKGLVELDDQVGDRRREDRSHGRAGGGDLKLDGRVKEAGRESRVADLTARRYRRTRREGSSSRSLA